MSLWTKPPRFYIGRVIGGAALALAGLLALFALYALSLELATFNVYGVLCSLVYVMLCLPALPLFILGRRVWRKSATGRGR